MRITRFLVKATRLPVVAMCLLLAVPALAGEADESLRRAIDMFEQGRYGDAQELLLGIDRDSLGDSDQSLRDEYVDKVRVAITMFEKAELDLEDALEYQESDNLAQASKYFEAVVKNEYATKEQRSKAREQLDRIKQHEEVVASVEAVGGHEVVEVAESVGQELPEIDSDRANTLAREGYEALESGRVSEAMRLFSEALRHVPGHPAATAGMREAQSRSEVEVGSHALIERIKRTNQINWQRTVQQCRDLQQEVQDYVLKDEFGLARQSLLRLRQVAEAGRQYADPVLKYEAMLAEIEALSRHVDQESRRYDEVRVREQRETIQRKELERQQRIEESRRRQVASLMDRAIQLRKDRKYEEAISVLDQVIAIEPTNEQAQFFKDTLQDTLQLTLQRVYREANYREQQVILTEAEHSKVPWHEELPRYPANWREIVNSPHRAATGRERLSPEDRQVHEKLDTPIRIDFDEQSLEEVFDILEETQAVNINEIWNDLEAVGIDRDYPVTQTYRSEVKFRRVLDDVLDQVGGGEVELGYVVGDGVIKVATRALLDRDVYIDVYDIEDLLLTVPDFTDGPRVEISGEGEGGGGGGGGMGGGMMGGGGMGGGMGGMMGGGMMGGGNNQPFSGGEGGEEDDDDEGDREERVEDLLDLIRNTIAPDSWRESGGTVAAIAELNGQLVVTQTASAHAEIQDLLGKLREQRATQIAIEARFITITANYLEELGLDLDIVLNQGNAGFDIVGSGPSGERLLLPRSFSRLGFTPGVPGSGVPLVTGDSASTGGGGGFGGGTTGGLRQPYGYVATVPSAGNGLVHGSNMTPIPIISNVLDLVTPTETVVPNSFGGVTTPAMQMFGSFLDGIQVDFLLRATQADRRSSIMNAPRLVLFNGQRSWIGVLNATTYVASVYPMVEEAAVALRPQPSQLLTGTVLDVQAVVSANKRYVTMNLRPGVSQPVGPLTRFAFSGGAAGAAAAADAFIQLPSTQKQVIRTTVSVPDGGTLLIGGMKTTQEIETEAGVPILSKIPVLKRLYSAKNMVKDEQVLLILVKPTILIQAETEEKAISPFADGE